MQGARPQRARQDQVRDRGHLGGGLHLQHGLEHVDRVQRATLEDERVREARSQQRIVRDALPVLEQLAVQREGLAEALKVEERVGAPPQLPAPCRGRQRVELEPRQQLEGARRVAVEEAGLGQGHDQGRAAGTDEPRLEVRAQLGARLGQHAELHVDLSDAHPRPIGLGQRVVGAQRRAVLADHGEAVDRVEPLGELVEELGAQVYGARVHRDVGLAEDPEGLPGIAGGVGARGLQGAPARAAGRHRQPGVLGELRQLAQGRHPIVFLGVEDDQGAVGVERLQLVSRLAHLLAHEPALHARHEVGFPGRGGDGGDRRRRVRTRPAVLCGRGRRCEQAEHQERSADPGSAVHAPAECNGRAAGRPLAREVAAGEEVRDTRVPELPTGRSCRRESDGDGRDASERWRRAYLRRTSIPA